MSNNKNITKSAMKIDQKISNIINQIAIDAGREIIKIYNKPFTTKMKQDRSPVTKADLVATKSALVTGLRSCFILVVKGLL